MLSRNGPRRLVRLAWLLAGIAVVAGSLIPGDSLPLRWLAQMHIGDKFQHFSAYAGLLFLPTLTERRRTLLVAAILTILAGVLLEFAQRYVAGRFFETGDMAADTVGVLFGLAFGLPLRNLAIWRE